MKLRTRLMLFTAASALSANMAFAAIDPQALADSYVAEGYTYVEVKTGPTQTKLEAVKGDVKAEVVYDNATGEVIKKEFEEVDDDYAGKTGVEIEDSDEDFEDADEDEDDETDEDEEDEEDDEGDDDEGDDDEGDDDEGGDDEGGDGDGDGDDDDDEGGDDEGGEGDGDDDDDDDDDDDKN